MSSPLDQERAEMILALNGNPVNAEMAWQIIHRWDALVNVAKAAEGVMTQMDYETPHHTRLREALAALHKDPA